MSDRDDLARALHELSESLPNTWHNEMDYHRAVAAGLIMRGWRRSTVTPEQLLAVVQILDDVPAVRFLETWMRKARDIARAFGLSVAEDGEQ